MSNLNSRLSRLEGATTGPAISCIAWHVVDVPPVPLQRAEWPGKGLTWERLADESESDFDIRVTREALSQYPGQIAWLIFS